MPTLDLIQDRLAAHRPRLAGEARGPRMEAAVAIVLHEPEPGAGEVLLIHRAEHEGDPWSGHMSFPGGRHDPGDTDLGYTAARETLEEVGLQLDDPIGRLDDFQGSRNPSVGELRVAPFVFTVSERPTLSPNHEVQSPVWIPLRWMLAPASAGVYRIQRDGDASAFPAIDYRGYRVWGLTYRILTDFFGLLDRRLPGSEA